MTALSMSIRNTLAVFTVLVLFSGCVAVEPEVELVLASHDEPVEEIFKDIDPNKAKAAGIDPYEGWIQYP